MRSFFLIFCINIQGCMSIHDCEIFPALIAEIENPAKKQHSIDPAEIINDPLHQVALVSECKLF